MKTFFKNLFGLSRIRRRIRTINGQNVEEIPFIGEQGEGEEIAYRVIRCSLGEGEGNIGFKLAGSHLIIIPFDEDFLNREEVEGRVAQLEDIMSAKIFAGDDVRIERRNKENAEYSAEIWEASPRLFMQNYLFEFPYTCLRSPYIEVNASFLEENARILELQNMTVDSFFKRVCFIFPPGHNQKYFVHGEVDLQTGRMEDYFIVQGACEVEIAFDERALS